ncbi:MAG: MFS transporter [Azospirillaceae bacterium]
MSDYRAVMLAVVPLLISALIMITGNGLFGTLLSLRMDIEGFDIGNVGLILACYALGFSVGTQVVPKLVDTVGHIRNFVAFAAVMGATALVHQLFVSEVLWAALRFVTGFSAACLFTIIESWLNAKSNNQVRGRVLAVYMAVNYIAYGGAQPLIMVTDPGGFELFAVVSFLVVLSIVPISLTRVETPPDIPSERLSFRALIRISPLGVAACMAAGMINGAVGALAPIYAREIDPSTSFIAFFMMAAIFGGFLIQVPMGRLSDRVDRRKVIIGVALGEGALALVIVLIGGFSTPILLFLLFIFGGLAYTLYPLGLTHANDFMDSRFLVPAAAGLLLCFGIGSTIGPIVASQAMGLIGRDGLFVYIAVVAALVAGFAAYRMTRRPPVSEEAKSGFVAYATVTTAGTELDPRVEEMDDQLFFDFASTGGHPAQPRVTGPDDLAQAA